MKWLLVVIFNTIETPVNTFNTAKECEFTKINIAQFFVESRANLNEKENARFVCKGIK